MCSWCTQGQSYLSFYHHFRQVAGFTLPKTGTVYFTMNLRKIISAEATPKTLEFCVTVK
jgi:hypothetical protein